MPNHFDLDHLRALRRRLFGDIYDWAGSLGGTTSTSIAAADRLGAEHVYWVYARNVETKTIQVRKVPPAVHRSLRERAASEGVSLSDYVLRELEQLAARPLVADVLRRAERIPGSVAASETVAAIRERRDRE